MHETYPKIPSVPSKPDDYERDLNTNRGTYEVDELTVDATPIDWCGITSPGASETVSVNSVPYDYHRVDTNTVTLKFF
jgi:hypothetical protein